MAPHATWLGELLRDIPGNSSQAKGPPVSTVLALDLEPMFGVLTELRRYAADVTPTAVGELAADPDVSMYLR